MRYGDDANACGAVKLQFDAGRGTTMRLSQLGIRPEQLNAIFFTYTHNDHTEGFPDLVQLRWSVNGTGPKIDVVCSVDAVSPLGVMISCSKFTAHVADAFIQSGEIAQRHSELKERTAGGPAELINTITFQPTNEPQVVWSFGDLKVSAIRSTHIAGHASYRVDTPAGSVVIGGDASNDVPAPPRSSSTSEQVEKLPKGADVIVHSAIHPIMGPDKGSGMFPYAYLRQSSVPDLGDMAQRRRETPNAHPLDPANRRGPAISLQGPGRPPHGSRLQEGSPRWGIYRKYHRRNRTRKSSPSCEVSRVQTVRCPSWSSGSASRSRRSRNLRYASNTDRTDASQGKVFTRSFARRLADHRKTALKKRAQLRRSPSSASKPEAVAG